MKFESTTCKSKALLLTAVNKISFFNRTLCVATTVQFFSEFAVAGTDLTTYSSSSSLSSSSSNMGKGNSIEHNLLHLITHPAGSSSWLSRPCRQSQISDTKG